MQRIRQNYGRTPVGPGTKPVHSLHKCSEILDQPVLELNPLNFHIYFLIVPTSQKGASYQIVKKSLFVPYKKCFQKQKEKKKRVQLY
jgi:hypothetical protein